MYLSRSAEQVHGHGSACQLPSDRGPKSFTIPKLEASFMSSWRHVHSGGYLQTMFKLVVLVADNGAGISGNGKLQPPGLTSPPAASCWLRHEVLVARERVSQRMSEPQRKSGAARDCRGPTTTRVPTQAVEASRIRHLRKKAQPSVGAPWQQLCGFIRKAGSGVRRVRPITRCADT